MERVEEENQQRKASRVSCTKINENFIKEISRKIGPQCERLREENKILFSLRMKFLKN